MLGEFRGIGSMILPSSLSKALPVLGTPYRTQSSSAWHPPWQLTMIGTSPLPPCLLFLSLKNSVVSLVFLGFTFSIYLVSCIFLLFLCFVLLFVIVHLLAFWSDLGTPTLQHSQNMFSSPIHSHWYSWTVDHSWTLIKLSYLILISKQKWMNNIVIIINILWSSLQIMRKDSILKICNIVISSKAHLFYGKMYHVNSQHST